MRRAAIVLALVPALALLDGAARGEETEENFVYMPAPNAESLTIDQPLGHLVIKGWDSPEVRIHSTKRAPDGATLDRLKVSVEMADGKIRIQTGVRVGETFRPMPSKSARIDLTIDAPRGATLHATTWSGDLNASGFRAGAELASTGGEVRAHDIQGKVSSRAAKGRQWLEAIRGDVQARGEGTGDLELAHIDGEILDANVVEGQITAREVSSPEVRLSSVAGGVVFIGTLRPGGRYQLTVLDGDVRLELKPVPFTVEARASGRVDSRFALRGQVAPNRVSADFQGGGPTLRLAAEHGNISLAPLR